MAKTKSGASKKGAQEPFKQVVPGLLVSSNIKMTIPHPDPCFVIRDEQDKNSWSVDGSLAIFSNEQLAAAYVNKIQLKGAHVKSFSWVELVKKLSQAFPDCIIDPTGEAGYVSTVPLVVGI